jgi:hypothetical protein
MAEDSVKNPEPPKDDSNPSGVTTLVTVNQHGAKVERLKGKDGKFVAKPKPLIPTQEFIRARRKKLARQRKDCGMTEDMAIFQELIDAMHVSNEDPKGNVDPKILQAKANIAEVIWLFSQGKPGMSEEDKSALTKSPVRIVYVKEKVSDTPVRQELKEEAKKTAPSFAQVTQVITNEK